MHKKLKLSLKLSQVRTHDARKAQLESEDGQGNYIINENTKANQKKSSPQSARDDDIFKSSPKRSLVYPKKAKCVPA
ncbi:hypothetical protein BK139_13515 [Paenibacillus sp. FSL R5-0490]|nr:hypothetical protein BK139_13515 [Paenibacillus sp. FSL R5-0490]